MRSRGHVQISLFILPGSRVKEEMSRPALWGQTAALLAHRPPGGGGADLRTSPAGEATLLWTRALALKLHQGNRHKVLRAMSALECPCQSKGGGIPSDPSCWLTLDVWWRGGACVGKRKILKSWCHQLLRSLFLFLLTGIRPHPVACTCRHGPFHMDTRGSYSMPFLSIWLAAISMTLMMKAMAKAQMRLFLTHVWRFFFEGWTDMKKRKKKNIENTNENHWTVSVKGLFSAGRHEYNEERRHFRRWRDWSASALLQLWSVSW